MVRITKGILKTGNASTRRRLTYKEFIESYKEYKIEKAERIAQAKEEAI